MFSIIGLIFDLKFSFVYKFCSLFFSLEILMFSWVMEFLKNVLALSLKQDFMNSHQSLAEKCLFFFLNKKATSL